MFGLALLVAACNANFTEAFEVDEPRLMAARVEVKDAPARPWPKVGEPFMMRLLVARSNKASALPLARQLSGAVSVCLGGTLPTGGLYCILELPQSVLQGEGVGALDNQVASFEELDIPLSFGDADPRELTGTSDILLFGAVCVEGAIQRVNGKVAGKDSTSELFRCVDNKNAELKDPLAFSNLVTIDYTDDDRPANLNPSFACDPAQQDSICHVGSSRDGEARRGGSIVLVRPVPSGAPKTATRRLVEWPEVLAAPVTPLAYEGCADDSRFDALKVKVGSGEHLIRIRFDPGDRETYTFDTVRLNKPVTITRREELLVSHAATKDFGALTRYFSIVSADADDGHAEIEVPYTAPKKSDDPLTRVTEQGRLVRFYFAVRDQRGGVDFTTRSLCLVP